MKGQIRVTLTISEEQERTIAEAYARYLLREDEHLSRNNWMKKIIMKEIE